LEEGGPPEFDGGSKGVGEAVVAEGAEVAVEELGDLGFAGFFAKEAEATVVLWLEVDAVHSRSSSGRGW
jgi:hypothetical protein